MAAHGDSDDEDTFVTLGTPLEVPDEDDVRKKPVFVSDMQAKDSRGRPRFHGAFTGGFSAGYFNTVGSKEGFVPSTFVSSREKKSDGVETHRPEDFMDEEDMGEYGIAPRKFVTGTQFASEERKRRRQQDAQRATSDSILPGESALLDLIVPEKITVGVKLLRKMGWKEGQGLGPRLTRKQKHKAARKVYGCAGPPSSDSDDGLDDETVLSDITYAPTDTAQIFLGSKDNTHGLGYSGLDPRKALPSTHINLFEGPRVKKSSSSRKGIRGQAFGVGALEDDDDDIYGVDDMSKYDMTMGGEEDDKFGWTAPKHRGHKQQTPVGYVGKLLDGFSLSTKKLVQKKDFPPPTLPKHYRPVHRFIKQETETALSMSGPTVGTDYRQFLKPADTSVTMVTQQSQSGQSNTTIDSQKKHDATSRSMALGEQAFVGSVFDLIPAQDRDKMNKARQGDVSQEANTTETVQSATRPVNAESSRSSAGDERQNNVPLFKGAVSFKPFSKDPSKQLRYEKYLELVKQGHKDPYSCIMVQGHTEWEVEKEKEEFHKASSLFRPLAGMMAMRFTRGGNIEDEGKEEVKVQETTDQSDAGKAAQMKMYGKLTRDVQEWHPDKLICKRFNVPNPYPGSTIVGLATVKRDKYSVFNFLNFANPTDTAAWERDKTSQDQSSSISTTGENSTNTTAPSNSAEKTTDDTSRVDKELNKGKAMKSIFSHLMETETKTQKATKTVSFSLKPTKTNKPKEFKSIFSHLEESEQTVKSVATETVQAADKTGNLNNNDTVPAVSSKKDSKDISQKTDDTTGIDLFRAIFRNTDSEDSSSSEDEPVNARDSSLQVVQGHQAKDSAQEQDVTKDGEQIQTKDTVNVEEKMDVDVTATTQPSSLPGNSAESRLSPQQSSDEADSYGPALPPPMERGEDSSINQAAYIDLTVESSRKHKHKHKDRHKHKKDKKEKHKKSKHKKKGKKKEKKRKQDRHDSESSDTTDKDTSDEEGVDTDKEILNRLKSIKSSQKLRVTDLL